MLAGDREAEVSGEVGRPIDSSHLRLVCVRGQGAAWGEETDCSTEGKAIQGRAIHENRALSGNPEVKGELANRSKV